MNVYSVIKIPIYVSMPNVNRLKWERTLNAYVISLKITIILREIRLYLNSFR